MKYYIIAGEASGDMHASKLIHYLKIYDQTAEFRFFGGDLMSAEAGVKPVKHIRDTAFMGVFDIIKNSDKIRENFKVCKEDLLAYRPDVLILVDYPGFNLKMAKFAKEHGIKVFYYISPKIWAWKKNRYKKIKKYVDKLFVIFPFEIEFYKQYDYEVEYLGNPTVDEIEQFKANNEPKEKIIEYLGLDTGKPILALLPGSRKQELEKLLPVMVEVAKKFPQYQTVVAGMSLLDKHLYAPAAGLPIIYDNTYKLLSIADAALVTSGTATLETALFNVPQVVLYKTGWMSYLIGSLFVHIEYFSLVNIVAGRKVVEELLQRKLVSRSASVLDKIVNDNEYKQNILEGYAQIKSKLGDKGVAERTAKRIVELLKN